jgi:ATP-dependent exoDNAse (exonuclease V) beta subunit
MDLPETWNFTYSKLRAFENCPKAFHHRYVAKDVRDELGAAARHGTAVHAALEARVKTGETSDLTAPHEPVIGLLLATAPWQAEVEVAVDADWGAAAWSGSWLRGKIDLHAHNASTNRVVLLDWKTGKVREDKFELQVQAALLEPIYPGATFSGFYYWLKTQAPGMLYSLDVGAARRRVSALAAKVAASDPDPKPGPLCGYCPVTACRFWRPG